MNSYLLAEIRKKRIEAESELIELKTFLERLGQGMLQKNPDDQSVNGFINALGLASAKNSVVSGKKNKPKKKI